MCTGFWWGNLREGNHWGDPDVDGRIVLIRMVGRDLQRFWWGNLRERVHWGDPDVDGRIILRWMGQRCAQDSVGEM
jgi:hypothetical protein